MRGDIHTYLLNLCERHQVPVTPKQAALFRQFAAADERLNAYAQILKTEDQIVKDWNEQRAIAEVVEKPVQIANGRVGRPYTFALDPASLGLTDIAFFEIGNVAGTGLDYDEATHTLRGVPAAAGEFRLHFRFRHSLSDAGAPLSVKEIPLIINPDPKSLWQDKPSDRDDPYWKADAETLALDMAGKKLVIASKRGRSHAHEGTFRDDDFKAARLDNGWGVIALADGAGSAKRSRRGSTIACEHIVAHFRDQVHADQWTALEAAIAASPGEATPETQQVLSQLMLGHMGKAAMNAHNAIAREAADNQAALRDYGTTLLFALVKQLDTGYFITSFWVGDGGIGIYDREQHAVRVLGTPDGGEFAGQTRFLTMPDIFKSADFYKRFTIKFVPDFTALILMTDGITDPKFGTDANLGRADKWAELLDDLHGANDDGLKVNLTPGNEYAADELLSWLDFWSPGNHDDRTIAILY